MAVALDRSRYFAAQLSENIAETPEGYRICRNVVIARTGFQIYKAGELTDPNGILGDRSPDEDVEVWRDPSEVFSPATLASFEGKTFTLGHPENLLDPDTERDHHAGHIQNVRRGTEPLDSGDLPMLADVMVTNRDAIRAIDTGEREVSCGYTYKLAREGYRFDQRNIRGNHAALVPKGRAGAEARINDAAPNKERTPVKNVFKHLIGLGFQSFAKDAKPEELAEALEAVRSETSKRSVAKDEEGEEKPSMDRKKRMHDILDRMLSESEKQTEEQEKQDSADLEELQKVLGSKNKEGNDEESEEGEDAHPEGCRCEDCMDKGKDAESEEEEEKKAEGEDSEIVNEEPVLTPEERPKSVFDAARTLEMLRAFKPFVARAKDKALQSAFDTMVKSVKTAISGEKKSTGSYAKFGKAASKVSDSKVKDSQDWKPKESEAQRRARENDEMYANAAKERREKTRARR